MGSKLAVLAELIALAWCSSARAETPAELSKRGVDLYKAGKYAEAADVLSRAYAEDPKPELLFTLAQAERLAGNCTAAVPHYRKVIEQVGDFNVAKLVQQNLSICEKSMPPRIEAPAADPKPSKPLEKAPVAEAKPVTVTKTVVHTRTAHDPLFAAFLGVGVLALGGAGGLYLAAANDRDSADKARSLGAHDSLADRADLERTVSALTAGAGVVLVGLAAYRWLREDAAPSDDGSNEISVVPTSQGAFVSYGNRW